MTDSAYPRVVIAGERSGSGKSTITIGILAALKARGLEPQPFKVGPDFLDPMHHTMATGKRSRNLDTWMFAPQVQELFTKAAGRSKISVIEGVMGLYDGADGCREEGSTAHLAKVLKAPVVLVIDAHATSRSAGAIACGFQAYDPDVKIAGVIFNRVSGRRHLDMLEASLRGIPCLGGIPRQESMALESRHLGLVPASENPDAGRYHRMREAVEANLDLDLLVQIATETQPLPAPQPEREEAMERVRIGVAHDAAFNFYYHDNLEILCAHGASVEFFSPLRDPLPDVDAIYLGGGYPELLCRELRSNSGLMCDLGKAVNSGMPLYAECGGMMYLCREIVDLDGAHHPMTGIFDTTAEMTKRLQALGYVEATATRDNVLAKKGESGRGHVFHYSRLIDAGETAFDLDKEKGIKGKGDIMTRNNCLAGYVHLHFASCQNFARRFVDQAQAYRERGGSA